MPGNPKRNTMISVLMASYNYAAYLEEAIRSVLSQTWREFELLVVDDGSRDGSVALARSFAEHDSRVRVLQHPDGGNHGLAATLQLGLANARGEWVAFLESDDIWTPDCLEQRMKRAQESAADVVFNAITPLPMPGADTTWFESYVPRVMAEHAHREQPRFSLRREMLEENKIPTFSCAMIKTETLRRCSFETPVFRWLDWWLWAQTAATGSFAFLPEKCTLWRLHSGSFNHKLSLCQYIQDASAFWTGLRRLLLPLYRRQGSVREARLLSAPFWTLFIARFRAIVRKEGLAQTLKSILQRINK